MSKTLKQYRHSKNASLDFWKAFKFKSNNFMTPNLVAIFYVNNFAVELSRGDGFKREKLYGVTVVDTSDSSRRCDLSQCCHSVQEVHQAISKVRGEL